MTRISAGRCSGAKGTSAFSVATSAASTRAGAERSAPPCTTRCPMASGSGSPRPSSSPRSVRTAAAWSLTPDPIRSTLPRATSRSPFASTSKRACFSDDEPQLIDRIRMFPRRTRNADLQRRIMANGSTKRTHELPRSAYGVVDRLSSAPRSRALRNCPRVRHPARRPRARRHLSRPRRQARGQGAGARCRHRDHSRANPLVERRGARARVALPGQHSHSPVRARVRDPRDVRVGRAERVRR